MSKKRTESVDGAPSESDERPQSGLGEVQGCTGSLNGSTLNPVFSPRSHMTRRGGADSLPPESVIEDESLEKPTTGRLELERVHLPSMRTLLASTGGEERNALQVGQQFFPSQQQGAATTQQQQQQQQQQQGGGGRAGGTGGPGQVSLVNASENHGQENPRGLRGGVLTSSSSSRGIGSLTEATSQRYVLPPVPSVLYPPAVFRSVPVLPTFPALPAAIQGPPPPPQLAATATAPAPAPATTGAPPPAAAAAALTPYPAAVPPVMLTAGGFPVAGPLQQQQQPVLLVRQVRRQLPLVRPVQVLRPSQAQQQLQRMFFVRPPQTHFYVAAPTYAAPAPPPPPVVLPRAEVLEDQLYCCVVGCTRRKSRRDRKSMRLTTGRMFKPIYIKRGWTGICSYHYFSQLYKSKKKIDTHPEKDKPAET